MSSYLGAKCDEVVFEVGEPPLERCHRLTVLAEVIRYGHLLVLENRNIPASLRLQGYNTTVKGSEGTSSNTEGTWNI